MFWRFAYQQTPHLDQVLAKENLALEELFQEEDLLQEVKTQNSKLLEFLVRPENLRKMLSWLVQIPEEVEEPLRYKLPYIACEVLCCEAQPVVEALSATKEILNGAWTILDRQSPLNPIQASYFAKVMIMLLARQPDRMLDYIFNRENVVTKLISHLEASAIADLLIRIFTSDDARETDVAAQWLKQQGLVPKLIDQLDPKQNEQTHAIAALAVQDLISACFHSQSMDPQVLNHNVIISELKSRPVIKRLVDHILGGEGDNASSALINGIAILVELIRKGTTTFEAQPQTQQSPEMGGESAMLAPQMPMFRRDSLEIAELVEVLISEIGAFKALVETPRTPIQPCDTTLGKLVPLGQERLNLMQLFTELLHVETAHVFKKFHECRIFLMALDLFFTFQWNNLLHHHVFDMVFCLFRVPASISKDCVISVFNEGQLTKKILQAVRLNNYQLEKPKATRLGYMGHITLITDHILAFLERERENKDLMDAINDHLQTEDWQEYVTRIHRETVEKNSKILGGQKPTMFSTQDSEDESNSNSHVDMNTDQLARFLVQQVTMGLPGAFQVENTSRGLASFIQESTFDLEPSAAADEIKTDEDSDSDDGREIHQKSEDTLNSSFPIAFSNDTTRASASVEATFDDAFGQISLVAQTENQMAFAESDAFGVPGSTGLASMTVVDSGNASQDSQSMKSINSQNSSEVKPPADAVPNEVIGEAKEELKVAANEETEKTSEQSLEQKSLSLPAYQEPPSAEDE